MLLTLQRHFSSLVTISCYSVNGRNVGIKALLEDEWVFMNEVGIEITMDQAIIIRDKFKKHQSEVSKL